MAKRVVAYCRVSTDHEDQANSLKNQKQYWEEYINNREDMIFSGLYVDEGITGTSIVKREGFNNMMRDAVLKKFDLILTKEVSRFGRNIIDVLQSTRKLKQLGIGVYFESDNINTLDNDGELRLSIMATLAQEESRKISERVKWGHKRAMKNGVVFGRNTILGYDLIDKKLYINEQEADTVKKIFKWYLEGESLHGIVRRLNNEGIIEGKTGGQMNHSSIRRILSNEKYCGDLKQRKYYIEDYLTHKQTKNRGEKDFISIKDNHEPIISREIFNKVQELMNKRQKKLKKEKIGYSRRVWGGKIECMECGSKYRSRTLKNKDGSARTVWKCNTNYNMGRKGCPNGSYIREDILERVVMDVLKELTDDQRQKEIMQDVIDVLEENMKEGSLYSKDIGNIQNQLEKILKSKERLLDLYIDQDFAISKEELDRKQIALTLKENELRKTLYEYENVQHIMKDKKEGLNEFYRFLDANIDSTEFNEQFVRDYIQKIEVFDKGKSLRIYFIMGARDVDLQEYPQRVNTGDY